MKKLAGVLAGLMVAGCLAGCAEDEPKDIYVESTGTWLKRTEVDAAVQQFCNHFDKCFALGTALVDEDCAEMYTFKIESSPECYSAIKAQFNCMESIACEDLDALSCEDEIQSVMFCTLGMSGFSGF